MAYNPAFDGLRALAVLAVLAFHCKLPFALGGFVGVDVFFVLSGYLITSLLLGEAEATGQRRLSLHHLRADTEIMTAHASVDHDPRR